MKNVMMLLGAIVLTAVLIKETIMNKSPKHIRSREDDPSIPPVSTRAF